MPPISNQLSEALIESEAWVDDEGYAHDDEGNKWFVGKQFAGGTFNPRDLPQQGSRSKPDRIDNSRRVEAFMKLPAHQRDGAFGQSILQQLRAGRAMTEPQRKAIRQMFYKARLRDLADLFR